MGIRQLYVVMPKWERCAGREWLYFLISEFIRRKYRVTVIAPVSLYPPDIDADVFYIPKEVLTPYTSAPFSMPSHIKELVLSGEKVLISLPYNSLALSLSSILKDIKGQYYVIWHHMCKPTFLGVEKKSHARLLKYAKKVFVPYPGLPLPTEDVNVVRAPLPRIDVPFTTYYLRVFLPELKLYEPFPYRAMLRVKAGATPASLPGEWRDIWREVLDNQLPTLRETFVWYSHEIWEGI
ncbi:hypothetical protein GM182_01320 [bacterium 3DAC]|jgi:hypothetical protein|nr:hypothetical protein [Dictyoglomota bacterium]UZN22580.1 hypothetical protein GM182_01320 [bacterium 3DAC]